jgi:hypothetical protein
MGSSASTLADIVKLKSGQIHKGAVTAEEEGRVQFTLEGSGVRVWFQKDQIVSLEKDSKERLQQKAEPVETEEGTEGMTEDMVRARELLKKLREQPQSSNTQTKSGATTVAPVEASAPEAPSGSSDEIEALIEQLRSGQFYDRLKACKELGNLGAKEAIPHLIHFLDDENVKIREESNNSLVKITGQNFGFKATDRRNVRLWAIDEWKKWYEKEHADSDFNLKWLW